MSDDVKVTTLDSAVVNNSTLTFTGAMTSNLRLDSHTITRRYDFEYQVRFVKESLDKVHSTIRTEIQEYYKNAIENTGMSAGIDLKAAIAEPVTLAPGTTAMITTGLSIWIDDSGYCAKIYPRSGLGSKGLVVGNLVGVIDADYQGELLVCAWNRTTDYKQIEPGDRIAQLCFEKVCSGFPTFVDEFTGTTSRGAQGFGHSGVK